MAEAGNLFECSICLERFVNPRILNCGHSYCSNPKPCLQGVLLSESRECSVCRTPIEERLQHESQCTVNYELKAAAEGNEQPVQAPSNQNGYEQCKTHKQAKEYFCEQSGCKVCICKDCWRNDHGSHLVVLMENPLNQLTAKMEKSLKLIASCPKTVGKVINESVDLNSELVMTMDKWNALMDKKNKIKNTTNFPRAKTLETSITKDLEALKVQNVQTKQKLAKLTAMAQSCEDVEDCIQNALLALDATPSSSKTTASVANACDRGETTHDEKKRKITYILRVEDAREPEIFGLSCKIIGTSGDWLLARLNCLTRTSQGELKLKSKDLGRLESLEILKGDLVKLDCFREIRVFTKKNINCALDLQRLCAIFESEKAHCQKITIWSGDSEEFFTLPNSLNDSV